MNTVLTEEERASLGQDAILTPTLIMGIEHRIIQALRNRSPVADAIDAEMIFSAGDLAIHAAKVFPTSYSQVEGFVPDNWVVEAVMRGIEQGRMQGKREADAQHQLIEEAQAEENGVMSTSIIRANMVAMAEAVMEGHYLRSLDRSDPSKDHVEITINLEAQRTVWDRMELETSRSKDETEVIFRVTRK